MTTQLLAGIITVPLLVLVVSFARYQKYLALKSTCLEATSFGQLYVAYLLVFRAYERATKFLFWWNFSISRHANLLLLMTERLKYELDRVTEFEKPADKGFNPLWRRSFLAQLGIAHTDLFGVSMDKYTGPIRFTKKLAGPRTPMDSVIEAKLFELYSKQALLLLRTGGFLPFVNFLYGTQEKFKRYTEEVPFAVLGRDSWISEVSFSNSNEISERLMCFLKDPKSMSLKEVGNFLIFDESFIKYFPLEVQQKAASFKDRRGVKVAKVVTFGKE